MSLRYTSTEKWSDGWFANLRPIEKLLFIYFCDNCDIGGFIEYTPRKWASDIGTTQKEIEGAMKGLSRGLIPSISGDCFFIRNFLKHQGNLPINILNNAHRGILKRFDLYKHKFNIQDIEQFIEGATKGVESPISNSNSNSNCNVNVKGADNLESESEGAGNLKPESLQERKLRLLEVRRETFRIKVFERANKYPEKMLQAFFDYWSESTKTNSQMKWETRETFEIDRRLATWKSNENKFSKGETFHATDF